MHMTQQKNVTFKLTSTNESDFGGGGSGRFDRSLGPTIGFKGQKSPPKSENPLIREILSSPEVAILPDT